MNKENDKETYFFDDFNKPLSSELHNSKIVYSPFPELSNQDEEIQFIIKKLSEFGIALNPVFTIEDLKKTDLWDAIDNLRGIELAYYVFWMFGYRWYHPNNKKEFVPISNDVWYRDMEFNSDVRYDEMLLSINMLTHNQLNLKNIINIFDPENKSAGLRFDLYEKQYELEFKYNNDWADPCFFEKIREILKPYLKKNIYKVQEGQGGIFVYLTEEIMIRLTGFLHFKREMTLVI